MMSDFMNGLEFEFQQAGQGVPAGIYEAEFLGIEPLKTKQGKDALKWLFKMNDGKTIAGFCDPVPPTDKNKVGKWVVGLSGIPFSPAVKVKPSQYVGRKYRVVMVPNGNYTKLDTFAPMML